MKTTIKIIIIGFLAGIFGAYCFSLIRPQEELSNKNYEEAKPAEFTSFRRNNIITPPENADFVSAASQGIQSVVYIKTVSGSYEESGLWDWFFNQSPGKQVSSGSGV